MIQNIPNEADAIRAAKAEPLGILPQPKELPPRLASRRVIARSSCDYVQAYPVRAPGINKEQLARGGYLIRHQTWIPMWQEPVKHAIDTLCQPPPSRASPA